MNACRHIIICTWCIVLCAAAEKSRSHLSHPWHELLSPFPRWRPAPSLSHSLHVWQHESSANCSAAQQNLKHRGKRAHFMRKLLSCRQPLTREKFVAEEERLLVLKVCLPLTLYTDIAKGTGIISLDRKEEASGPFASLKVLENFVAFLKLAQEVSLRP